MRKAFTATCVGMLLVVCGAASGQIPYLNESIVTIATEEGAPFTLMVRPDGLGPDFTRGRDSSGNIVDMTVTLTVIVYPNAPVANFPAEDMWIAAIDGGMVACGGGGLGIPDRDTDAEGTTEWRLPPRAGGWSNAGCRVYINGDALSRYPQLPLHFNSPDLSGDLVVSLSDVGSFASDLFAGYAFRADFNGDGAVNLTDAGLMSDAWGSTCP